VRAPTRIGLLAALAVLVAAPAPAQASVTIGQTQGAAESCSSPNVNVQDGTPGYVAPSDGVVVSWSYLAGTHTPNLKLRLYQPGSSPTEWIARSESAEKPPGTGAGQVGASRLNSFPESPGIPIKSGYHLGLTTSGAGASSWGCIGTASSSDLIRQKTPPDPAIDTPATFPGAALTNFKLDLSAVIEPDADGDHFGDETQDSCPTDPAVHTGGCPVDLSIVKSASPNPRVGDNLAYGLSVKNNSTINPALGVTVIDTLPAGVTFVSAVTSQGTCSGTTTVICSLGTVAPSGTPGIAIVVKPTTAGALSNTGSVTTTDNDTDTTNNSSTLLVNVAPPVPVISKYKVSPSTQSFAKPGATVSYNLNTAATTTHSVLKPAPGIKSGKTCVKPPKKPPKGAKKCTRFVPIGSFKHTDVAGKNKFRWNGKLKGKKVKPGSYRLQAVARNASGKSAAKQVGFKIK
jgi:uncharacterized repeat protein (TIGR01451 family)